MHKIFRNMMTILTAGVLAVGTASLAACGGNFVPPEGIPSGEIRDNGGFVVSKGDYVYFINGSADYTADNTYGTPVKGALMRIRESDVLAGRNTAETVIPSLMVAADYTSGIYIYGDRVYYATPSTVENTSGVVLNSYLDFKSAALDGTGIENYLNLSDNATVYRYVQEKDTVYLLYVTESELHSYNTADGTDVTLASGIGEYLLDSADKTNPVVYYTMSVTPDLDIEDSGASARDYNQIYRVSAATTEAPYEYHWNEDYLNEHDGEAPYLNLGTAVLDGIGASNTENPTQLTHDLKEGVTPLSPAGFKYTLQSYNNGGIYFTRSEVTTTSTVGEDGWLYYLPESSLANNWNSITGNEAEHLDIVAQNTDNASTSAIFYIDEKDGYYHHYLYVSNSNLFRADVKRDGNGVPDVTRIAIGVGSATLSRIDASATDYQYVYYTVSGGSGVNIHRAVYNGTEEQYKTLNYEDNKPFRPVQILEVEHASSWYPFEIVNDVLYYCDAASIGSTSYNYISAVSLKNTTNTLMNNVELATFREGYEETVGDEGTFAKLEEDGKTNLATALRYFYETGETELFYANIEEAKTETGKEHTLYSEDEVKEFKEYTENETSAKRSDYILSLGTRTEEDEDLIETYWKNTLQHYTAPETTEEGGLPNWAWALIGIAIGLVLIGAGLVIFFLVRRKKGETAPKKEKMFVDTTDDRDVDVYAPEPEPQPEEVEESAEEPAEESVEPAEEAAEPAEPAEEPAEAPAETPAEDKETPAE